MSVTASVLSWHTGRAKPTHRTDRGRTLPVPVNAVNAGTPDRTHLALIFIMSSSPPPPRLCHLKKWAHFDGYGFNLHAEKNKPGQFVGKIDADSPAEAAGLREGDRIVEVNGRVALIVALPLILTSLRIIPS